MSLTPNENENQGEPASLSHLLWAIVVTLIGFGFAIYRYIEFFGDAEVIRLTRIERLVYRAIGPWGLISIFVLMGLVGVWYTVNVVRELRKK